VSHNKLTRSKKKWLLIWNKNIDSKESKMTSKVTHTMSSD
jgi:hypothetical protein